MFHYEVAPPILKMLYSLDRVSFASQSVDFSMVCRHGFITLVPSPNGPGCSQETPSRLNSASLPSDYSLMSSIPVFHYFLFPCSPWTWSSLVLFSFPLSFPTALEVSDASSIQRLSPQGFRPLGQYCGFPKLFSSAGLRFCLCRSLSNASGLIISMNDLRSLFRRAIDPGLLVCTHTLPSPHEVGDGGG